MISTKVSVTKREICFSVNKLPFSCILSPYVHKGAVAHSTYFIDKNDCFSFRVELKGMEHHCKHVFDNAKDELSMSPDDFPYGLTGPQWWEYAMSPHSYLVLEKGTYQVGLNYFNRFLHLDAKKSEAYFVNPGVTDEFLSTTNWLDGQTGELWFASWNVYETLRRNFNPLDKVTVTIWKFSLRDTKATRVWQGELGDSLHQLSLSPDKKFLVLAELGLRPKESSPSKKLAPSKVLILALKTMQEWRLELPTAAHVEFDPNDPSICYLSGHNIGLIGPKVGIFGPGVIKKYRLTQSGPQLLKSFSHPLFYRITTHIVFNQKDKTYIAVSGYPGSIFLIDATNMQLDKVIEMPSDDYVDTSQLPHLCLQDSYGITASNDGKYLFVCATGTLRIIDLQTNKFLMEEAIEGDTSFTGHIAQNNRAAVAYDETM